MDLRPLIAEWVKENGCSGPWLLRLWNHLIARGASSSDAVVAITEFVDDAIRAKHQKPRQAP